MLTTHSKQKKEKREKERGRERESFVTDSTMESESQIFEKPQLFSSRFSPIPPRTASSSLFTSPPSPHLFCSSSSSPPSPIELFRLARRSARSSCARSYSSAIFRRFGAGSRRISDSSKFPVRERKRELRARTCGD